MLGALNSDVFYFVTKRLSRFAIKIAVVQPEFRVTDGKIYIYLCDENLWTHKNKSGT